MQGNWLFCCLTFYRQTLSIIKSAKTMSDHLLVDITRREFGSDRMFW